MGYDFVVLGSTGMQGRIVSRDLLENKYSVLMCGRDKSRVDDILKKHKNTKFEYFEADSINKTFSLLKKSGSKIAINCVEGNWNIHILKSCIKAGLSCIDLGSDIPITKKQFAMDSKLKERKIINLTGCGSVPGIGNVMLSHAIQKFDTVSDIDVGFSWDSNIKKFVVPFSIPSIIEEFTAPANIVKNHRMKRVMPMKSLLFCSHREIEREPQFNVGHHPETFTFYRFCKDKGIKNINFFAGFPKHSFDTINKMIELGLGSNKKINFKGQKIAPVEYLTEILKKVKFPEGYKEKENLWVEIRGKRNNRKKKILMECIIPPLKGWEDAGCNVDTGMPASIIAQMIKKGIIKETGSFAPEDVVPAEFFFKEIGKRKMKVLENGQRIN